MAYRIYLLNIASWLQESPDGGALLQERSAAQALSLLCKERAEKVLRNRTRKGQAQSLGAGLLLQYLWYAQEPGAGGADIFAEISEENLGDTLINCSIEELLTYLQPRPVAELPLRYGQKGKPFFESNYENQNNESNHNNHMYFSLSHSGTYVLCAVSDRDIGADIQECKDRLSEQLVKRVLSEEELNRWSEFGADTRQARSYFYQRWTEKEARGKLTGEGVLNELARKQQKTGVCVKSDWIADDYCVAIAYYDG